MRATDAQGNTDATPADRGFTVDTVAPTATISDPAAGATISSQSVSVAFSASEPASFACGLDRTTLAPCNSAKTYSGLAEGAHTVSVRATDSAGNAGSTAERSFTVDTKVSGAKIKADKKQKQKRSKIKVKVKLTAKEDATGIGAGKIKIGKKSYALKKLTKNLRAGRRRR